MSRSALKSVLIDCQTDDLDAAVAFWSAALHLAPGPEGSGDRYRSLRGGSVGVLLQRAEWPSSYHLDVEADDVDAEAERLVGLGATKKRKVGTWWVMRAPTGHDFCVVERRPA